MTHNQTGQQNNDIDEKGYKPILALPRRKSQRNAAAGLLHESGLIFSRRLHLDANLDNPYNIADTSDEDEDDKIASDGGFQRYSDDCKNKKKRKIPNLGGNGAYVPSSPPKSIPYRPPYSCTGIDKHARRSSIVDKRQILRTIWCKRLLPPPRPRQSTAMDVPDTYFSFLWPSMLTSIHCMSITV